MVTSSEATKSPGPIPPGNGQKEAKPMTKVTTTEERPSFNIFDNDMVVVKTVTYDDGSSETFKGVASTIEEARTNADNAIRSR